MSYAPRPAVGVGPRHSPPSSSGSVGSKRGPPVTGPIATGPGGGGGGGGGGTGVGGGTGGGAGGAGSGGAGHGGTSQPPRLGNMAPSKAAAAGPAAGSLGHPSKPISAYRSLELCDALKREINDIASEIGQQQQDREEYEKKFRQQIAEMEQIQLSLKQLKDDHLVMKQHYEEEILRLRRKLDQTHKGESDGRVGSNSAQGASGGMSMGSTGAGQSYCSSPQQPQGGGVKGLGGIGGSTLASPRKQQGQPGPGAASLRGPMFAPGGLMGGGPGGQHVVLPGMPGRGRGMPEDEYGGVGRAMGPNGHTMEPLIKRIRLGDPPGPGGVFLPPHGGHRVLRGFSHDPPSDHRQHQSQQQQQHHHSLEGPGGLRPPGGAGTGADSSHRLAEPSGMIGGSGNSGGIDGYRGSGGLTPGMASGPVVSSSKSGSGTGGLGRDGPTSSLGGSGGGGTGGGSGGGNGGSNAVDIPDAIPAELSYHVRYEGDGGGDRDRGSGGGRRGAGGLSVELAKSQDLRSVVCCVRFSTDGTKVAAGSHSCVKVFDVFTFRQLYVCRKQLQEAQGHSEADPYVRAVCFSPDGRSIVAGMEKNSARVLLLGENGGRQEPITLSDHESEVYSLDWVSTMIASGSGDGRIRLWHSVTGALQASLGDVAGPQDGVTSVVLKQDTSMVAAASIDRIVHVWSTQTHKLLHRLDGHTESVYAVTFSHDGNTLVSGGLDKTIKVWDLGPGSEGRLSPQAQTLPGGHSDYVLSVCFSQDGKYIISGSKDRSVTIWDAKLMKRVATITGFKNSVIGVSASPTKGTFATGSGDNLVCVWNYGERSVTAPPSLSSTSGGGGSSNSSDGGGFQRRGTSSIDAMDACSSKESEGKGAGGVDKAKGGIDGKGSGGGGGGGLDGRKRGSGTGNEGGREAAMERDGKTSATEEDGQRSSGFGEKNKSSVTVGDSKEGPAPRDGPHSSKSVNSSVGVGGGGGGGGYDSAMAARRRSPVHSDVRAGNGHGHGYGHGSITTERDRERMREGRGAVGDDNDKRGGGSTQDGRRREDAGDRSPKKRAAATVASMAVSGGNGGRGGSGPGGHVGSEGGLARGGLSPERRSLPPKKDIQRRDSPPAPES